MIKRPMISQLHTQYI